MDVDALLSWAAMGRHGLYVWLAYGVSIAVLLGVSLQTRFDASGLKRELEAEIRLKTHAGQQSS
jgi:heme exporter protein D